MPETKMTDLVQNHMLCLLLDNIVGYHIHDIHHHFERQLGCRRKKKLKKQLRFERDCVILLATVFCLEVRVCRDAPGLVVVMSLHGSLSFCSCVCLLLVVVVLLLLLLLQTAVLMSAESADEC